MDLGGPSTASLVAAGFGRRRRGSVGIEVRWIHGDGQREVKDSGLQGDYGVYRVGMIHGED
jgi:hypothetical protein